MKNSRRGSSLILCLLFSCIGITGFSQKPGTDYTGAWKKIDDFISKGLPKSALAEVQKVYASAKKEKQDAQLIKAVIFMSQLQQENREDNETLSIAAVEKEAASASEPAASILKSLAADKYWQYLQGHRYQLYSRTETVNFNKDDVKTWTIEDFHRRISALYLQSIREEKLLQQTKLASYDPIIIKGNMRHLRPTLYDLLAQKALRYFENSERDIKKPAYAFEIDQAAAFDPAADFVTRKFVTPDSLSLEHKALLIYQKIIALHLRDANPDALLDADIQRIKFVYNRSTHPEKEQLYFAAMSHIANQYGDKPAAAQAWFWIANYYAMNAEGYKPFGDTTHRYDLNKALSICDRILQQRDSSEGRVNCYNLRQRITRKTLGFELEKVNLPGQPFRASVSYRNFSNLYLRVVRADEKLKNLMTNMYDDKSWAALASAPVVKGWQQPLPLPADHQEHRAEIKVEGLPAGEYVLIAAADNDFSSSKTVMGARFFYISSISYVNNGRDYFVLHRDNGQALVNASVQVWQQVYDYRQSKYTRQKGKHYTTDAHGHFVSEVPKKEADSYSNYSYLLDISYGGERLFLDDMIYDYYYNRPETDVEVISRTNVFLFTDRAIYRPGQTVFFKGIAIEKKAGMKGNSILPEYKSKIYLVNANDEKVDSMNVTTNEYGSFNGKFQLPQGGLNGIFSLQMADEEGNAQFSVEEYKRPKFYVDYDPIKSTYRVNDKLTVTGYAKAFAGNNIDGAQVKYRVVRNPRYIYPWLFWKGWQPPVREMEIAHGEIKTDKNGKFEISFTAIPDLTIDKKLDPIFDYTIYADVTDINGETRSGEQGVSVGYKSLMLVSQLPAILPADSLRSLYIRTENMNGEFQPAAITVRIKKLQEEKRLIRERFWDRPDQFVMTKAEYIRNFPYDEYDNETDYKTWEPLKEVFKKTDSARLSGNWPLQAAALAPGYYEVEITTRDKDGQEVKDVKYIELTNEKSAELSHPDYLWTGTLKTKVEPGQTALVELGTSADSLNMIQVLAYPEGTGNKDQYSFLQLSNEKRIFRFTPEEKDRGGFSAGWLFVKHNRVHQQTTTIDVPWTNKDLAIQYASFRDKTLPGSEEKWKLRITGYKNEKVAAELLATLYDASLDQFAPHYWSEPDLWPCCGGSIYWTSDKSFAKVDAIGRYGSQFVSAFVDKRYDELISENGMDDVVVVGYGTERKAFAAGKVENMVVADSAPIATYQFSTISGLTVTKEKYKDGDGRADIDDKNATTPGPGNSTVRKNFNETAFFFPDLRTDSTGAIEFSFTMPEALTQWKFMALAHTKDGAFGSSTKEIVTQKDLMVQPNAPRFLREGDKMEFSSKIVNLTGKELTGTAALQLFNAATNEPVDGWFRNMFPNQYFTVGAGQSEVVKFPIEVPYLFNKALTWRIVATSGDYSDGEENAMPVLTNRMLVTESITLPMRNSGTKNFTFDKLLHADNSTTLQHYALTVEYTSNPAWYAVQALPYLMEYPHECAEQTWNRYYANALAAYISNASPRIKQIFEQWKTKDTAALLSNLQKNQELKSVLLEETPWVLEAKNESQQKKNIALLFDMVKMGQQLNTALEKLKQMQTPNGGFCWFSGGPDDRYITQYIITGIGHLRKLGALSSNQADKLKSLLGDALPYLDKKIREDYDLLVKNKTDLKTYSPGYSTIQYLYMRSFFPEYAIDKNVQTAYAYFRGRVQKTWVGQSKYMQAMAALALYRTGDAITPAAILKSLKETAINNDELGMYWNNQPSGWFWYQAPVETQALLVEAFVEAGKDTKSADAIRTWLLKNKQTNNWATTKATAEACYALLIQGTNWLTNEPQVDIKLGNTPIRSSDLPGEPGAGYIKKIIDGPFVSPAMGNISVTVTPSNGGATTAPSWGAVYWQYFEDLDKISAAATPLQLNKKLFVETNTDRGPVLKPVNDGDVIKVGDKIKVRIELRVDRDMEYVHIKDMRAASLEPTDVLSGYKWQGGLGYYQSTKDASTNFFFDHLRKGTYVFEYTLFAAQAGDFSNGVSTIQCMYAPEFTAHSEGIRINVE